MFEELLKERDKILYSNPEEEVEKRIGLFDILNQIFTKSTKYEYDKKIANAYMLSVWLSHEPHLMEYVQEINHRQFNMSDKMVYDYYFNAVPKSKSLYIKYIKGAKQKDDSEVEEIMIDYDVSRREALMIKNHKERLDD